MSVAPVSTEVRRRAVVGRVDSGTKCHTAPAAGQSHPRNGSSGKVSIGTPRHSASSARALVVPSHATKAIAFGPVARACGRNSVAKAPTGAANRATAETGRGARRTIPERPPKSGQTPRPNEYAGEYPTGRPVDGEASLVAGWVPNRRVVAPNARFMIYGIAAGISVTTARRDPVTGADRRR